MHPSGQLPAYEWDFSDVNPPVHAHAARRVYEIAREVEGRADTDFLEEVFHKLLLNFTWWVNRKDPDGRNAFQGGFLGLDNIGVFDRSRPDLPGAAGWSRPTGRPGWACSASTCWPSPWSWPARGRPTRRSPPSSSSTSSPSRTPSTASAGRSGCGTRQDGFYYDVIREPGGAAGAPADPLVRGAGAAVRRRWRSSRDALDRLPHFRRRMEWYLKYRPTLAGNPCLLTRPGVGGQPAAGGRGPGEAGAGPAPDARPGAVPLRLRPAVDVAGAWPPSPITCHGGVVAYEPAESTTPMYGGNSNWRGPIWFPVNFLMIEALREYHRYFGDSLRVELPRGSGRPATLGEVADELARRLIADLPPRRGPGRPTPRLRGQRPVPGRPALARPRPLLRVLPRRARGRARRQPPDRLDGAGRRALPAARMPPVMTVALPIYWPYHDVHHPDLTGPAIPDDGARSRTSPSPSGSRRRGASCRNRRRPPRPRPAPAPR